MLPQVVKLGGIALDFLFPERCVGCGKEGAFICSSCRRLLERIEPPVCPKCGLPQASEALCPNCIDWQAEITGIRSPFKFGGVMRQAVHQLKYQNVRTLATPLARMLQEYLTDNPLPADVLVPVPLHPKRLRERGYNQSELLAHELARLCGLPVIDRCLTRQKYVMPQARTAGVAERRGNVTDAFICTSREVNGKQVLLIDDVATSGATLNACAAALKAAGAASVWGLSLAREI